MKTYSTREQTHYQSAQDKTTSCSYSASWYWIPCVLALIGLTVAVYMWSLRYPFEFDDYANIVKYYSVRYKSWQDWMFQSSRWIGYLLNTFYYKWSPDTNKMDPFLYRCGATFFHLLAGMLVFSMVMLVKRLATHNAFLQKYGTFVAYAAAGLFLLHPVQTQTVSYVIQSELEGMAGLLMAAQANCFLLYCLARTQWQKILGALLLFTVTILACGTKESIVIAPVLLLLLDWFFVAQGNFHEIIRKRWWLHGIIFFAMVGYIGWHMGQEYLAKIFKFELQVQNNLGNILTDSFEAKIKPYPFFISQFKVLLHYIWMFFWPFSISVEYDWKLAKSFFAPDSFIPFLILCALAAYVVHRLRKNSTDLFSFGVLWFFIACLPRCSFIPSSELLVDYKTYISSIGLLFILGAGLVAAIDYIAQWFNRRCVTPLQYGVIITVVLSLVAAAAYQRNTVWRSPEEFWIDIIKHAPLKARAYNNYGVALCEHGKPKVAIKCFQQAIKLDDFYADPHNNLSVAYAAIGKIDEAIYEIKQSIRLMPAHPENYNNLATLLIEKNDLEHVEALFAQAIALRSFYGKCHYNWACFCHKQGRNEEALKHFKDACTIADYDNEIGFSAYARMSLMLHKYEDALFAAERWVTVSPQSFDAYAHVGQAAFMVKDYAKALQAYSIMQRMQPNNPAVYLHLGETFFFKGDYLPAYEQFTKVQSMDPNCYPAYSRRAECLEKLGRRSEVASVLLQLQAKNPPLEYRQKVDNYFKQNKMQ